MHFLRPTKRKLFTTVLFILIGFTFSVVSDLTSKAYKEYVKNTHFEGELLEEYENIIKQGPLAPPVKDNRIHELVKKIPPEAHKKVEQAGLFILWFTIISGVLITYIGACIAHREPKPRSAT
ncbi:conserved hypothetical protein [Pseudomonas sp. 8BK]|uniref:hypothetical protein n=1 Tax=Pseudomonas sp. 8BK TaxID=2653164 RepID=UPI0012F41395|nr:hypothetical protein [Pseudomonas sp. 8BK]VXB53855.1 conserved hypothetical protein [Pseudomonas sp. 8BK]